MSDAKSKDEDKTIACPTAEAMRKRYGRTTTKMRHRSDRRAKDAKRSWRRDEW